MLSIFYRGTFLIQIKSFSGEKIVNSWNMERQSVCRIGELNYVMAFTSLKTFQNNIEEIFFRT